MINKKIIIISLLVLMTVFIITYKKKFKNVTTTKKNNYTKVIGFQVCGIGNGHITQSKVVYNILIKKYRIPIVIIYGRNGGFDDYYKESKVIYKNMKIDAEGCNDMKTNKLLKELLNFKDSEKFEKVYGVNNWINFWIIDWFNYRTKQFAVASQLSLPHLTGLIFLNNLLSITIPISIFHKNSFSKYKFPSLIDDQKLDRSNVDKKMVVAYSVSGKVFPLLLNKIAKNNPGYTFNYFKNYDTNLITEKNIIQHKSSKLEFKNYLSKAGIVFCTSGNELIQECTYNKIPVGTIPCSRVHFEQNFNYKNYVKKFKWAEEMKEKINLEKLKEKNMNNYSKFIEDSLKDRDKIILELISKL